MRVIQRSFVWTGNAEKKKWALVAWNKLCKSKNLGGLNLLDPSTISRTCGAKLWWRWLKEPNLPWAKHWKEKYAPGYSNQDLIRMQESPDGSPIWNLARRNREIVQEHSFWEIRDGETALFWEDAWQQFSKLGGPEFADLQRQCQEMGRTTVNQYWNHSSRDQEWREWMFNETKNTTEANINVRDLLNLLNKRKIRKVDDKDQLRWGKKGSGNFTLKEARDHLENLEQIEEVQWSNKV